MCADYVHLETGLVPLLDCWVHVRLVIRGLQVLINNMLYLGTSPGCLLNDMGNDNIFFTPSKYIDCNIVLYFPILALE